jgi:phosphoenolpyruvate carboxykinase (ATP)
MIMQVNRFTRETLSQLAIERGEGVKAGNGALAVVTGQRTGRSPKDRFIVRDALTADTVDWGAVNQPMTAQLFEQLWVQTKAYQQSHDLITTFCHVGADPDHYLPVIAHTEFAWHALFAQNLFILPPVFNPKEKETWEIINVPNFPTDPSVPGINSDMTVAIDIANHRVLLRGAQYAGEMKKIMFSLLNYFLPEENILPMHCAANVGKNEHTALFFGLSGTGKTTLSADPDRALIGDDEHGWGESGVFNFEGGCYAKCIDLTKEHEPVIFDAIRPGAVMENVVLQGDGMPDYSDMAYSENSRCAYPREHIDNRVESNRGLEPDAVIFLTCDLYGVLPPVAILNNQQAAYYFLSGYTAMVGSTEVGSTERVKPTFSTCFGAPFFPRPARVYADLLLKNLKRTGAKVYLVNTGWTGGGYGSGGKRFSIPTTRSIITAIHTNAFVNAKTEQLPGFNVSIPMHCDKVDEALLNPQNTWNDKKAYQIASNQLIEKFQSNFKRFDVETTIKNAGPTSW